MGVSDTTGDYFGWVLSDRFAWKAERLRAAGADLSAEHADKVEGPKKL